MPTLAGERLLRLAKLLASLANSLPDRGPRHGAFLPCNFFTDLTVEPCNKLTNNDNKINQLLIA